MRGTIIQINVSRGGLPKRPIPEGTLTPLGFEGDASAHPKIHGGPAKAVLLICSEVIDSLIGQGYPLFYGALGENLTTRGLDHRDLRCGQRFRVGEAFIELTKVRSPCSALDVYGPSIQSAIFEKSIRDGNTASPLWGMGGFYAAVAHPAWCASTI
jgi:MOSC domain-containing protein YiiM